MRLMLDDGAAMGATAQIATVDVVTDWSAARERWCALAARGFAGMFQQTPWLDAWFSTLGRDGAVTPLITFLRDDAGRDRAGLPLVLRRSGYLRSIEFADGGLTDYCGPILASAADGAVLGEPEVWARICDALPPADVIRLRKMPAAIARATNGLARSPGSFTSTDAAHVLHIPDWEAWRQERGRFDRKEIARWLRVFERHDGARFERVTDLARARHVYCELQKIQRDRMADRVNYQLDEPAKADFYWRLIEANLASGYAVLTALTAGDEVVAALLGIAWNESYGMIRLAAASGQWASCSPGRLVIERTMQCLYQEGYRTFDFTIGEYDYKRRFGATPTPLRDMVQAKSLRGLPGVAQQRIRGMVRDCPELKRWADRLRGKQRKALD